MASGVGDMGGLSTAGGVVNSAGGKDVTGGNVDTISGRGGAPIGGSSGLTRNVTGGDSSGLNPHRARGFGDGFPRLETPRLADMKAKQGAIVAKFLTFFQRKSSLVIKLII